MWKSSYTCQAQLRIFTPCSSPALPVNILGPTLEDCFLTKDNVESPTVFYTNSSYDQSIYFCWHLMSGQFQLQGTKIGIQIGLNNEEISLPHDPENSRHRSWFQGNHDPVIQTVFPGDWLFSPIFLLCHPLGQLHIVFGSRMLASPRTTCFLNYIWQGRLYFSHCKY